MLANVPHGQLCTSMLGDVVIPGDHASPHLMMRKTDHYPFCSNSDAHDSELSRPPVLTYLCFLCDTEKVVTKE